MEKTFIIEVAARCDFEDLDPEDRAEEGECAVDGAYRMTLTGELASDQDPQARALERFNLIAPIACFENFSIVVRPERPDDSSLSLRDDLGEFGPVPKLQYPEDGSDLDFE